MRNQFPVGVNVIPLGRNAKRRYIDWYVKNTKECQRQHCWNSIQNGAPIRLFEIYPTAIESLLDLKTDKNNSCKLGVTLVTYQSRCRIANLALCLA